MVMKMFKKNKLYYEIKELKKLKLTALYSTKKAGSPAPYNNPNGLNELNKLINSIGLEKKMLVFAKQTHSDNIVVLEDEIKKSYEDVDGFVTKRKDIIIATFYADCLPIFIFDKKNEVIGLCHSGWVGTHKGIGNKMLNIFLEKYKSNPDDLIVVLGIGMKNCCYEVSEDFYEKFSLISSKELLEKSFNRKNGKLYFDNEDYNYFNFLDLGIKNVYKSNICTYCNEDFHSHRREGLNAGRNVALFSFDN